MHQDQPTIITKSEFSRRAAALCAGVFLLAAAVPVFAHGGFDHVIGTVAKVDHNMLTVTTAKGPVMVMLNDKTEITKDSKKAMQTDLKPGARVVVDIPEGSKDKMAHSVKIGVTAAADHDDDHDHAAHK
jgi:hypothetical protein